ncbi:hypothetical protein F5Y17DRAFT_434338 [Xylariaceae sp. FL0594]|nr:hypothetical protein F5Y17DRAFT_434338 [Xylariaceae sp. FL0594]
MSCFLSSSTKEPRVASIFPLRPCNTERSTDKARRPLEHNLPLSPAMEQTMKFYISGYAERGGSPQKPLGVACLILPGNNFETRPTASPLRDIINGNQARLEAVRVALEWAKEAHTPPCVLRVQICSYYQYVTDTLNDLEKNSHTKWRFQGGSPMANRDVLQKIFDLESEIKQIGTVTYTLAVDEECRRAETACWQAIRRERQSS